MLLLFFIIINNSFADEQAEVSLQKPAYSSKETMLADVLLKDLPVRTISAADLFLSEGKIAPIMVKDTDRHYYFYFDLPELADGNYNIGLNLLYNVNGILKTLNFNKEFSIENELSSISIRPAVLKIDAAKSENYQIYLKNNKAVLVDVNVQEESEHVSLSKSQIFLEGNAQKSFFAIVDKNKISSNQTTFAKIEHDDIVFDMPLLIFNFKEQTMPLPENQTMQEITNKTQANLSLANASNESGPGIIKTNATKRLVFISEEGKIIATITKGKFIGGPLVLKNYWDGKITQIRFNVSGDVDKMIRLNSTFFDEIRPNSQVTQYVFINEANDAEPGIYLGEISASSHEGYSASMPVEITVKAESAVDKGRSIISRITNTEEENMQEFETFNFSEAKATAKATEGKASRMPLLVLLIILAIFLFVFYKLMARKKPRTFEEYISRFGRK